MIDFFSRHWVEILDTSAKIAAIFAVIGIWVAYRQYKHSVDLAKKNERRAAVELAARECARYGESITKRTSELHLAIEKSGCQYLKHCKLIKEEQQLKLDTTAVTEEDKQEIIKFMPEILGTLNCLEGFAIPFASNVADDKVGYVECGRSFAMLFENFFPLYCIWNLQHYYQASQNIYWRWKKQIDRDELERKHLEIGKQFFVLSEKLVREKSKSRFAVAIASGLRKAADKITNKRSYE